MCDDLEDLDARKWETLRSANVSDVRLLVKTRRNTKTGSFCFCAACALLAFDRKILLDLAQLLNRSQYNATLSRSAKNSVVARSYLPLLLLLPPQLPLDLTTHCTCHGGQPNSMWANSSRSMFYYFSNSFLCFGKLLVNIGHFEIF